MEMKIVDELLNMINALEKRVTELENNNPERNMPEECQRHTCTYYTAYLAYGPKELEHEGFHAAEKNCEALQKRALDWLEKHKDDGQRFPESLDRMCRAAETRIRC